MDEQGKFNVEITFYGHFNGETGVYEHEKILYEDVIGYQMGSNAVAIMTKENETIIYPINEFTKVRHFPAAV
jgi:hypothetical protein